MRWSALEGRRWLGMSGTTQHATDSGLAYSWYYKPRQRRSAPRSELSIEAPGLIEFTLQKEGFGHLFAKALGFAREFQTQDFEFDDKCYILCDDVRFHHQLRGSAALRRALQHTLMQSADSICTRGGRLVADMKHARPQPDPSTANAVAEVLHKLRECAGGIAALPGYSKPIKLYGQIAIGLCAGLLALGIIGTTVQPYTMHNYDSIIRTALLYALPPVAVLFLLLRLIFGGSARGYHVLLAFLFLGIPGTGLVSYSALYTINTRYDTGAGQAVAVPILERYTTRHKRSTSYHIRIPDWQNSAGDFKRLKVSYADYQQTGRNARLWVRPGHLGWPWIERYEVIP